MTPSETKTRKYWLWFSLLVALLPIAVFVWDLIELKLGYDSGRALIMSLVPTIRSCSVMWILWHCAYRKCGTAFLTFCLVTTLIRQLLGIVAIVGLMLNKTSAGPIIGIAVELGLNFCWCVLSLKLRKINKALQKQKPPAAEAESAPQTT